MQQEVEDAVGEGGEVKTGPLLPSYRLPFTVRDRNLLTARWPGDAQRFGEELVAMLGE